MKGRRVKYAFLVLFSFLFCMTPPLLTFLYAWNWRVSEPRETVRVLFGIMTICFVVWHSLATGQEMGHLKTATFVFLGAILLQPAVEDLPLLAGTWLLGRAAYTVFFETALERQRAENDNRKGDERR